MLIRELGGQVSYEERLKIRSYLDYFSFRRSEGRRLIYLDHYIFYLNRTTRALLRLVRPMNLLCH